MTTPRVSEVLADLVEAIESYALDVQHLVGGPSVGTEGFRELGEQGRLIREEESEPVHTAHSAIRLGNFFVLDLFRSLGRLTIAEPPSVYAPFVLGRSVLDAAGWAYWLAEPGIGPDQRVQRNMALTVSQGNDQRVPRRPDFRAVRDEITHDRSRVRGFCDDHGWRFRRGGRGVSPLVGEATIPSRWALIEAVVADGTQGNQSEEPEAEQEGAGATFWWFLSGFTHGGLRALLHSVEANADADPATGTATIYVRADDFVRVLAASGRASVALTRRRTTLFGDGSDLVEQHGAELESLLSRYVYAVARGRLP